MTKAKSAASGQEPESSKVCGIVMPISDTASHTGADWAALLNLLKRAISSAGLEPKEAWVNANMDMITDRIISNLFAADIVICDITDHNPNVMFELGLRLSSKKPTIIIMEEGTQMPFDIKDFWALPYPKHLNYLKMEIFMGQLSQAIKDKISAFDSGSYQPFAERIANMEVLEPSEREVPFNRLVADQLEMLISRVERLDHDMRSKRPTDLRVRSMLYHNRNASEPEIPSWTPGQHWIYSFTVSRDQMSYLMRKFPAEFPEENVTLDRTEDGPYIATVKVLNSHLSSFKSALNTVGIIPEAIGLSA